LEGQAHLAEIDARNGFVKARTQMINFVRGKVKTFGSRIPSGLSPESFHKGARKYIPAELRSALSPVLEVLESLTSKIREQDKKIEALCKQRHPETKYLLQVNGVGPITALSFVLVVEDPTRFSTPREVGPYLGLVPRRRASGTIDPELSITKAGNGALRRLLVQCAHHILGHNGTDSDLRSWGLELSKRGKKGAKKRATIAVARKLAVVLLSLWVNEREYQAKRKKKAAA
jgi:transposase